MAQGKKRTTPPICIDCGKEQPLTGHMRRGRCPACAQRERRRDPAKYDKHKKLVLSYQRRNPEKTRTWRMNYNRSLPGYITPPDVHQLWKAVKKLEQTISIQNSKERTRADGAGEFGGDDDFE